MPALRVAAVQAAYVLMDRDATIDRVAALTAAAAADGARLVVFPEVFVPGTPIWIDTWPIWDGDEDWFGLLAANAVVIGGPASDRLAAIAAQHQVWLVVGVDEREEHGATIYNTVLYFSPDGVLAGRHRKLMPTGSERTVWGMGDGSTLRVVDTGLVRIGGLTCWENYMPLARFHMYAQGVDLWIAPTLAAGDGWVATMRHLARENRMFVIGVNPVLHADQIPVGFPGRERLLAPGYLERNGPWLEEGNTVAVAPDGTVIAGPVREREETLVVDLDLRAVAIERRHMDPVGHYHRPDVFRLHTDTSPRPAVVETQGNAGAAAEGAAAGQRMINEP
jgi:predicted amidohydrolase